MSNRSQPGSSNRTHQKIGGRKNQIRYRKCAAKTQPVGRSTAKDGHEPDHATEDSRQRPRLFSGEIQLPLQVQRKRSKRGIIRETFEDLTKICDPEGTLKPCADLVEAFGSGQRWLLEKSVNVVAFILDRFEFCTEVSLVPNRIPRYTDRLPSPASLHISQIRRPDKPSVF